MDRITRRIAIKAAAFGTATTVLQAGAGAQKSKDDMPSVADVLKMIKIPEKAQRYHSRGLIPVKLPELKTTEESEKAQRDHINRSKIKGGSEVICITDTSGNHLSFALKQTFPPNNAQGYYFWWCPRLTGRLGRRAIPRGTRRDPTVPPPSLASEAASHPPPCARATSAPPSKSYSYT